MDNTNSSPVQTLYDQDGLLDILLGVEKYFDDMDLYAYENWIDGELVEGPLVSKYWVEVTFKFDHDTFPDPLATLMFEKQGTKVFVKPDWEVGPVTHPRSLEDMETVAGQGAGFRIPADERKPIILYKFQIPRRIVNPESFDEYKLMSSDFNSNDEEEFAAAPEMDMDSEQDVEQMDAQFGGNDMQQGGL